MRRTASALASSALSRALLRSLDGVVARHRLLLLAATSSADRRWYSSGGSTKAAFVGLAVSAAGAASFFQEAYAKEPPSPELVPKDVVLYQYEACPFCNKVKAFLDYYDIPYKVVEVNPLSKKEIKWSDYKKVPILVVDGEQLVDSSAIIDKLGEKITPKKFTSAVIENDEEKKWRQWVDSHLVHILSPNIYRNTSEALESFDYITSNGKIFLNHKKVTEYHLMSELVRLIYVHPPV
ncbi:hypothetical protein RJ639_023032 [Escallonia herrerae]|uniref:GST N-terminal domain-containing protein n=1 Tax=Escallonia herrerae TaxID=1293975 RepID=A0AA89ACG2_9ASTE|nr:hypothetical protein RJ639_023032 [Escallonia herrerae]